MSEKKSSKKTNVVLAAFKKTVRFFKSKPLVALALIALAAGSVTLLNASAATGDCTDNSIVRCGAFSGGSGPTQANFNKNVANYHNADNIDKIYDHYGIDDTKLGNLAVGSVSSNGNIYLNGKVVATGARSTGRDWVPGSSAIKVPGYKDIYERDVQKIFKQGSIQAWIKVDANGKFQYAVLTVCGNPVVGTPVEPPQEPTGSVKCDNITVTKVDRVRFKFTVKGSATGAAKLTVFNLNYGDGTKDGRSPKGTFDHTYTKPGTYKVQGSAWGTLNGKTVAGAGVACATTIKVEKPPEEPNTPDFKIIKYVNGKDANDNGSAVSVKSNQEFEYKVVVTNTGETKLTNVKVWDVLPAGVTYVDNTLKLDGAAVGNDSDFFNASKGVVVKSIDISKSATFTMKAVIKANASEVEKKCAKDGTYYNNVAKADPEGSLPEKKDPAVVKCKEIPKVNKPGVDIEKDVSKSEVRVGEEFTWHLIVTNTGDIDLKNVKVTDSAPANVEFLSAPDVAGTKITVNAKKFEAVIANLKKDQVVEFDINAKVTAQVAGDIVNTACVDAPEVKDQGDNPDVDDCDDAKVRVPEEKCPVPGKENLPKDSSECKAEKCPIPGLENYDASSDLCKNVPPTEVPSTGGGELILMAGIALVIGAGVYAYTLRGGAKAKKA